jgi:GrpB-like predicted nucleotidyltransferase (UPF0157 family)
MPAAEHDITGLKRHTVRVVEHRPEWAELFGAEARDLRLAAGELAEDIQHVGSTAVPGLPAKPIIDVAIAIRSRTAIPELAERLVDDGYIDRGDGGQNGGWLLVKESAPNIRSFHVHIVERSDPQWGNYLAFRDALRQDATLRDRYAALKRGLAAQFAGDRKSYTKAKHEFIRGTLKDLSQP